MAEVRIEINRNDNGEVGWQLCCYRQGKNNDAETSEVINVMQKLNRFVKDIENTNLTTQ